MRLLRCFVLAFVLLGLIAGSAWPNHDHRAKFAGVWILDPKGKPGELKLAVKTKTAGSAKLLDITDGKGGCGRNNFCSGDPCQGERNAHWYIGTFKTPSDHGPVVGCTWGNNGSAHLWFRSTNFGGKVGLIEWTPPSACATAAGNIPGPCFDLVIKFSRHFDGDGAEALGRATVVFGAHQFFNDGGDVAVALSVKADGSRCKKPRCHLDLEPTGRYFGLYTQEDNDFRARFRATDVFLDRYEDGQVAAKVVGRVTDRKGGGQGCKIGDRVSVRGVLEHGKPSKRVNAHVNCRGAEHFFRKFGLRVTGSALSG